MTIDEKAKEFAGYNNPQGIITTTAMMVGKYEGFRAGARWMLGMLDKVMMDLPEDCEVFDILGGRPVKADDFRKALEE